MRAQRHKPDRLNAKANCNGNGMMLNACQFEPIPMQGHAMRTIRTLEEALRPERSSEEYGDRPLGFRLLQK